ncbi:MAG TPA: DNA repair exonuclease [Pyrodictiaceae archaeon]|nr:DNA repair exonuclease [Pyrodictiaceae archaeon]HIP85851.1 DNA repair exonuclease [Pyrodictium sp.]HIQ55222.1 DNA repair exonuclease [Pyrodictium sp.]
MGIYVLHTSDTHLGYRQYGIVERENDVYDVFGEIIDIALREHVDLVVHSGDFFDSIRPPPQAILIAIRHLRRLREKGIPFITILGDHDTPKRRVLPPLVLLEELGYVRLVGVGEQRLAYTVKTRSGEVFVAGISNKRKTSSSVLKLMLKKLSNPPSSIPSILLLHQCIRGMCIDYELELGDIPIGYTYYALGHVHTYKEFEIGDGVAVYPGSPEVMRVDEFRAQSERYIVLTELGKGVAYRQKIRLQRVRPQYELVIDDIESMELKVKQFIADIVSRGRASKKPFVYVRVVGGEYNRSKILNVLERFLRRVVLDYRVYIEKKSDDIGITVEGIEHVAKPLDKLELLEKLLGDKSLAELADTLIAILSSGSESEALRESLKIVLERYDIDIEFTPTSIARASTKRSSTRGSLDLLLRQQSRMR